MVLTFGAALLVRTQQNLQQVDGGFETRNLLVFAIDARDTAFPAERVVGLCNDVLDRIRTRPGVVSAACSTMWRWRESNCSNCCVFSSAMAA